MRRDDRFRWLKQFSALVSVICAVGFCATYLVYRQASESSAITGRSYLTTTAVQSAQFVFESDPSAGSSISAWSPGVKRVTIFNESEDGRFSSVGTEVAESIDIHLSTEADEAIKSQLPVVSDVLRVNEGVPSRAVYVPLSPTSLAVVEIDEQTLSLPKSELDQAFRSALFSVGLLAVVFSLVLCGTKWMNLSAFKTGLGKLTTRRVWITIGLLAISGALLFDGSHGFKQISRASERGSQAERTLTVCNETSVDMSFLHGGINKEAIDSASQYFSSIGEHGLAKLGAELTRQRVPDESLVVLYRLRLNDLETKSLMTFREANTVIQYENSAQSIRLMMVVALGLFAVLLMSAVSVKERELELTMDETSLAKLEYSSLIGNLPIGLFAYSNGKVLFSNGAWELGASNDPSEVLAQLTENDRLALERALDQAQFDKQPFSGTVTIPGARRTRHYETFGAPVIDDNGRLKRILVFCINVTKLVEANDEIQRKHEEVEEKNYQLRAAITHVEGALETLVETMVRAVETRDPYTAGHSTRVGHYSVWIGHRMGLSEFDLRILANGALCHDVGKIGIPDNILLKPDRLTEAEFSVIKQHPSIGARILGDIGLFRNSLPIVKWHHERLDGSGYPDGLVGNEIPLLVRIVAVADVFDALTSSRSYRGRMTIDEALGIIETEVAAGKLDPRAFDCLREAILENGTIPQEEAA